MEIPCVGCPFSGDLVGCAPSNEMLDMLGISEARLVLHCFNARLQEQTAKEDRVAAETHAIWTTLSVEKINELDNDRTPELVKQHEALGAEETHRAALVNNVFLCAVGDYVRRDTPETNIAEERVIFPATSEGVAAWRAYANCVEFIMPDERSDIGRTIFLGDRKRNRYKASVVAIRPIPTITIGERWLDNGQRERIVLSPSKACRSIVVGSNDYPRDAKLELLKVTISKDELLKGEDQKLDYFNADAVARHCDPENDMLTFDQVMSPEQSSSYPQALRVERLEEISDEDMQAFDIIGHLPHLMARLNLSEASSEAWQDEYRTVRQILDTWPGHANSPEGEQAMAQLEERNLQQPYARALRERLLAK